MSQLLLIAAALLFFTTQKGGTMNNKPRGIRNNNPGNLIITTIPWVGKVKKENNTDGYYEQFITPHYGLRAMIMDIKGDVEKDGLNTLETLIPIYAPEKGVPTENYISFVAKKAGIKKDSVIDIKKDLINIVKGIIEFENGVMPYSNAQLYGALNDAYSQ